MLRAYQRLMAADNESRLNNQARLRELKRAHGREIRPFCAHDAKELEELAVAPIDAAPWQLRRSLSTRRRKTACRASGSSRAISARIRRAWLNLVLTERPTSRREPRMHHFAQLRMSGTYILANDRSQRTGLKGYVCAE